MKKLLSAMAILLAVALFPLSFSGSSSSSAISALHLVVMEGQTISLNAGESKSGYTYQWMIGGQFCDESTATKYGVAFSGGNTSSLTISNMNSKLNNVTFECYSSIYGTRFRIYYKILQVVEYKPVTPTISTIQSVTVNKNEECKLTVSATASDGGTLSYLWYEASAENTKEIAPIDGALGSTFTCDTSKGGIRYYLCKVTNTKKGKSNFAFSNVASVTVSTPVPTLEYNTKKANILPEETVTLKATILLSESERGQITYQWYESIKNDPDKAKAISGATSDTVTVNGSEHSGMTYYYFCKITNELNGEKYTNIDDGMAMIEVTFAGQHVHEYGEWKITAEPACTEDGIKTRTCECGEKQTETISALGHEFGEWTVITEATEDQEGLEERSCTRCSSTETRVIPVIAAQSNETASVDLSEMPTAVSQDKSDWWIVIVVAAGAAGGAAYGLILVKKNKKSKTIDK